MTGRTPHLMLLVILSLDVYVSVYHTQKLKCCVLFSEDNFYMQLTENCKCLHDLCLCEKSTFKKRDLKSGRPSNTLS